MVEHSEQTTRLATLFETVTGQSMVTEHQEADVTVRVAEHGADGDVAVYVETTATASGLEDAIDEPETY